MTSDVRRVVTGHDANGKAMIAKDQRLATQMLPSGDAAFVKIWTTAVSPADPNDPTDGAERPTALTCPGGTVIRVVDHYPGARSPMHRTQSVDYAICLEGRIDMELDNGEVVHLNTGDILVQLGTNHAWVNNYDENARMAFILIDAEPVLIDGKRLDEVEADVGASHL